MSRLADLHTWQAWLAERGIMSFPLFGITRGECRCPDGPSCRQPGKHPRVGGWRRFTEPRPVTGVDNLGVSTDKLVVVDIDYDGPTPDDLPPTFTVSTGRGRHLWYLANPTHPIRNAAAWRPGIDIRSVGGLVAAPGSEHSTGRTYQYLGGVFEDVPDVVVATRQRHVERDRRSVTHVPHTTHDMMLPVIDGLVDDIKAAPSGERNHTLFKCSCRFFELADKGWAGADSLQRIFDAAIQIGLGVPEIQACIASASTQVPD